MRPVTERVAEAVGYPPAVLRDSRLDQPLDRSDHSLDRTATCRPLAELPGKLPACRHDLVAIVRHRP